MKACVIGLGYVGFPTACLIARAGHQVLGVDSSATLVDKLSDGELHIVNEAGLEELARSVIQSGRLRMSTRPAEADIFILAVPTPIRHDGLPTTCREELERPEVDYLADLSYLEAATRSIAPFVRQNNLVIVESTVPPMTTNRLVREILVEEGVDVSTLSFAHAPERVLPGNLVHELVHNDRIIGGVTPEASRRAREFYQTFVRGSVLITDATTAELVKLMENTFRDVNIGLANEFALVCQHLGVDVWEATQLANLHPRVNFLRPGPGVGGHCIAVDPYFVVEVAPGLTSIIQAARHVNQRMPLHVINLLTELAQGVQVRKVAILGASYKADVGDERESPAIKVADLLTETDVEVRIHDPYIPKYNQPIEKVLTGADAVLVLTDHSVYQELDPHMVGGIVTHRLLLDTRGRVNVTDWRAAGFRVLQLGIGQSIDVATTV